jgi:hypothetical protein
MAPPRGRSKRLVLEERVGKDTNNRVIAMGQRMQVGCSGWLLVEVGGTQRCEIEVGEPGGARGRWGAPGGGSALRRLGRRANAGVARGSVRGAAPKDLGGGGGRESRRRQRCELTGEGYRGDAKPPVQKTVEDGAASLHGGDRVRSSRVASHF